tara:strand:- start:514 stop:1020 length:507 start_codon:yes stop_codon:yes gene_type:complete
MSSIWEVDEAIKGNNDVGEMLRRLTFGSEDIGLGLGCLENFQVLDDWTPKILGEDDLSVRTLLHGPDAKLPEVQTRYVGYEFKRLDIECYWTWNGNGVLVYRVPAISLDDDGGIAMTSNHIIFNQDCRKENGWDVVVDEASDHWLNISMKMEGYYRNGSDVIPRVVVG